MKPVVTLVLGGHLATFLSRDNCGNYFEEKSELGVRKRHVTRELSRDDAAALAVQLMRYGGRTEWPELVEAFGDGKVGALARVCRLTDS